MDLSKFSIRRPVFTIVTMVLVIILGGVSLFKLPLKLIPEINPPVGVVVATYPGASPDEVLEKLTKPLEASLATLPGIKNIHSISQEGSNFILLEFSWSTSIDDIQNDVQQRIHQTPLPSDATQPSFLKFDPSQFPIIQLSLSTENVDKQNLHKISDTLITQLSKVDGVASINVNGKFVEEIMVIIDQEALKQQGLSQSDIVSIIQANNISLPGETVLTDGKQLTTRIVSALHSVEEIADLPVTINPVTGHKVLLSDVATIKQQEQEQYTSTRTNDNPALLLSVLQETDANTAEVSKEFQQELERLLEQDQFKDIKADVLFDQGDYIQIAISNISTSLLFGGVFAMLILFLFLRNVKSPLIVGIAIPYSVIVTFVLMFFANFALNIMTLGALALGIGMLVDNAIVVIENINRHLSLGKNSKEAAHVGTKEVAGAITASTLTTVAVFLPVVFISGLLGELFKEFALTISFSLFASLFVALTVIPMLASRFIKKTRGNYKVSRRRAKMNFFERSLRWSLKHRIIVLVSAILLFVGGMYGVRAVGVQFLPPTDEGFFSIRVQLENGAAITETEKVINIMEEQLKSEVIVDTYVSLVGSTQESSFQGVGKANTAEMYIKLKPLDKREVSLFEFVDEIQPRIEKAVHDINTNVNLDFNIPTSSGLEPQTLTFYIKDTNKSLLDEYSEKIMFSLSNLDHVTDINTNTEDSVEEIKIKINREKAMEAGLNPAQIAMVVNDVTRGVHASQIMTDESDVLDVIVQYDEAVTREIDKLATLLIRKPDRNYIELGDISDIEIGNGPLNIQRINQQDSIQFTLIYDNQIDLGAMRELIEKEFDQLKLPDSMEITYSGEIEMLDDSINDMILALVLAIIFIYIVMAAQFESFKYPFVIMFTIPLIAIGVGVALFITQTKLSVPVFIGIIVLAGIVVNNAIVLVDYINKRKEQGLASYEAIIESVKVRTRPILMTALTTILGLIPLSLGIGEGTEMNQPMAIAVIGGLISSTFLTLLIIPIVYSLFDKETRKMNRKKVRWSDNVNN